MTSTPEEVVKTRLSAGQEDVALKLLISFGLPETVKKIDAALHDEKSGKTLFFVGNECYSYNEAKKKMDQGFPKRVDKIFSGLTGKVTAAFQDEGYAYIYSGSDVFEYHLETKTFFRKLHNNVFLPCTES